jgi:uncharacterized protein YjbI with pentapeptide repeats
VAEYWRYSEVGARAVANDEHLAILRQGVDVWNEWREKNPVIVPDLSLAVLVREKLSGADLLDANLIGANLADADLEGAILWHADLTSADLRGANLSDAGFDEAKFIRTDLTGANLRGAVLTKSAIIAANLHEADLTDAVLGWTILVPLHLDRAIGLEQCKHSGPSVIDLHTILRSPNLPISFLRGCGVPENVIEYLPSLRGDAIRFYSCFISHSSKDQAFADRLHADLQNKGVRCWFAPHDLPIGAKIWDAIDEAIHLRDKLLVILSEASIASDWVEDEVNKAFAEERDRKETVLFPIRVDNTVMTTPEPWARKLRDQRKIGDFLQWEKPLEYQKSLKRLLRHLKAPGRPRQKSSTSPAG